MAEVSSPIVTLALCGFGRAGNMHLTSIRYNYRCQLKYVVDIPAALDSIRSTLKTFNLTDVRVVSVDEFESIVLSDKNLMAVLVTTPTDTHEEYVCKSLKAHKAVFCEKPIANSVEVAKNCYVEASKVQLPLLCAFNRRFDSGFAGIRKQVEEGKIGKVHLVKTTSRDSPLPSLSYLKVSNGMFHDCAVHDIDVVCWIVGEEPYEVYAQSHAHSSDIADINDVDTIAIVMKFPSGVLSIIDLSRHSSYGYDQRLEVSLSIGLIFYACSFVGIWRKRVIKSYKCL